MRNGRSFCHIIAIYVGNYVKLEQKGQLFAKKVVIMQSKYAERHATETIPYYISGYYNHSDGGLYGKGQSEPDRHPRRSGYQSQRSLVFAARKTGDFNHVLAVIDSLADAGDFSPIHADNYRCEAYFFLGQAEKSLECLRRATTHNPRHYTIRMKRIGQ